MPDDPLIEHVERPAGRRASLIGGPDAWEVSTTFQGNDHDIDATTDYLELRRELVEAAVHYYESHRDEIDERIARNKAAFDRAYPQARPDEVDERLARNQDATGRDGPV